MLSNIHGGGGEGVAGCHLYTYRVCSLTPEANCGFAYVSICHLVGWFFCFSAAGRTCFLAFPFFMDNHKGYADWS